VGGGVVAAVEVSTDGARTWHRAEGTEHWSFDWHVPEGSGALTIMSRGIDDTVNVEVPRSGINVRYGRQASTGAK
jgi:hypothetical protein